MTATLITAHDLEIYVEQVGDDLDGPGQPVIIANLMRQAPRCQVSSGGTPRSDQ
jgi:hypothetical protein